MRVVSLFSGGGLGDYGFMMAGCEIVAQVEINEYCQKILALRYPDAKKFRDIRTVKGSDLPECDIITGGFPCQPFSNAGSKMGKADDRHLWPEMFRIISEVRPTWVVGENVSGFIDMALDDVLANLESIGYETTTFVFPAHAIGAPHRRERVWIVGYSKHAGRYATKVRKSTSQRSNGNTKGKNETSEPSGSSKQYEDVADTELCGRVYGQVKEQSAEAWINAQREFEPSGSDVPNTKSTEWELTGRTRSGRKRPSDVCSGQEWWAVEPRVGRVAHGVANRVHRLKLLGNGQVTYCTKFIAERIIEFNLRSPITEGKGKI